MVVDKIKRDLHQALKEKESLKVSTLRLLLSAIQEKEKEKRYKEDREINSEEIIEIIQSEAKKRRESIKSFELGSRDDLVDKEKKELSFLEDYLPEQISQDELEKIVRDTIDEVQAKDVRDFGKVMSKIMPKIKGKSDGSLISQKVKEILAS